MSSTKLFNIPSNTLRPGPDLTISRMPDGKSNATLTFTIRKFDLENNAIQNKLTKGTPLTTLYPEAGIRWNFLLLNEYEAADQPGGITQVVCRFQGVEAVDTDTSFEGREVTYTRNSSLRDVPIFDHPQFKDLTQSYKDAIKAVADGDAYKDSLWNIRLNRNDDVIANIGAGGGQTWYDIIITRGILTYLMPTSEWTKSSTGLGTLPAAMLSKLGKIDSAVPGNPAAPTDQTWMLTGATEQLTVTGDGVNSYSMTWTSGDWDETLYGSE